jgi:hypothetical protein
MLTGPDAQMIGDPQMVSQSILDPILYRGVQENKQRCRGQALKLSISLWLMLQQKLCGYKHYLNNWELKDPSLQDCGVIILEQLICQPIQYFMPGRNI